MRAHFVDHLLASLEGAVSPIWITVVALTDAPPDTARLRRAFEVLLGATPRLQRVWRGGCWTPRRWTAHDIERAVTATQTPRSLDAFMRTCSSLPAALDQAPAMRLHVAPVTVSGRDVWAVAAQLHHAMGDARALGRTLTRLWHAWHHDQLDEDPSPDVLMTDAQVLRWVARQWSAALNVVRPSRRLLARRALALPRDGDRIGSPIHHTILFDQLPGARTKGHAETFFSAVLAQAATMAPQREGLLRLRVPIDLSRELGWDGVLGNTCMAIPLEFDINAVRDRSDDASAMRALLFDTLSRAVAQGGPVATALECLISARLVPVSALRASAPGGFVAEPRTNTLVTTHMGRIDAYFAQAPFTLLGMSSHTSTWGAHAWTLGDRLGVHTTAFEGLWSPKTLADFAHGCAAWIEARGLGRAIPSSPLWEGGTDA